MKHILILSFLLTGLTSYSQSVPPYSITALDSVRSQGYYFLCSLQFGTGSGQTPRQLILDRYGRPVYFRTPTGPSGSDFKILPNGIISYNAPLRFYWKNNQFQLIDSITTVNGITFDSHDIQLLPNGHILLLGSETVTMDLSSYHMFTQNGSPGSATASVKCGVIQELDSARNVVFEWHCRNYYSFDDADEKFLGSPNNVDWTHFNAVELDQDGNLLVSVRHFDEITKINRSDSTIIWRLGGKRNQFLFTNDSAMFIGQHDIRRIANGNITLYDNGRQTPLHAARAKEYQLDETNHIATLAWSYTENPSFYSRSTGNVQRLPGGLTLVNYGTINTNLAFNVVDSLGTKVFEIVFADTAGSYRAYNYTSLPWSLPRPAISCDSASAQLSAPGGYGHYLWSTGDTTRNITLTTTGTYWVQVPLTDGGYIRSEYMQISDPANTCMVAGIPGIRESQFLLYPNPATNTLHIFPGTKSSSSIQIMDISGRVLNEIRANGNQEIELDVSGYAAGIYFVRMGSAVQKFIR